MAAMDTFGIPAEQRYVYNYKVRRQFTLMRSYFTWEFVESLARVRGVQVDAEYAEAFQVYRVIY